MAAGSRLDRAFIFRGVLIGSRLTGARMHQVALTGCQDGVLRLAIHAYRTSQDPQGLSKGVDLVNVGVTGFERAQQARLSRVAELQSRGFWFRFATRACRLLAPVQ